MTLFVTMGISGCGKSTAIKAYEKARAENNLKPAVVVSPDQIRKELTGSISNQSRNADVFALAYTRVKKALDSGNAVLFDSTALNGKTRKELLSIAHNGGHEAVLWVFKDSADPDLCRNRVIQDIHNGVDRADTQRADIIDRMFQQYSSALENIKTEGWDHISYK